MHPVGGVEAHIWYEWCERLKVLSTNVQPFFGNISLAFIKILNPRCVVQIYLLEGNLPVYEYLRRYPPEGVEYVVPASGDISVYYSRRIRIFRGFIRIINRLFGIPRLIYLNPNADLIHTNRGIIIVSKKPFVMDLDYVTAFTSFDPRPLMRWHTRRIIGRFLSSPRCKHILSWSKAAQNALWSYMRELPHAENIRNKTDVLYPAVPVRERAKTNEPPVILFSASLFREKGGPEFLEAAKRLSEKYDVRFIIKADVPEVYKRKYNLRNIEYHPYSSEVLPHGEYVQKFFARADIYAYPTFLDIFGLGILDAFSVGIPVVATDIFAVPEMVVDGETGLLIHVPDRYRWHDSSGLCNPRCMLPEGSMEWAVRELVAKLSLLIEDTSLRRKLGRTAFREVESGKFSISTRNRKLREVYESALRR